MIPRPIIPHGEKGFSAVLLRQLPGYAAKKHPDLPFDTASEIFYIALEDFWLIVRRGTMPILSGSHAQSIFGRILQRREADYFKSRWRLKDSKTLSLETPTGDEGGTLADTLPDDDPIIDEILERELSLLLKVEAPKHLGVDPDVWASALISSDTTGEFIAALGMAESTFYWRIHHSKTFLDFLTKYLEETPGSDDCLSMNTKNNRMEE